MSILFTFKGELDRWLYRIQMRQEALRFISGYRGYRLTAAIYSAVCVLGLTFSPVLVNKEKSATEKENEVLEDLNEEKGKKIGKSNKWIDFSVFKEKVFVVLTLSMSVAFIGHHIPRLHLVCC